MALSVEEALQRIIADVTPTPAELVPIAQAAGRILSEPLTARLTQPPFDASAMDGYAVRSADVEKLPVRLKVIGQAAAGHPFEGHVGPGEAVRIFTGAPLPVGADAIVIQENTVALDGSVEVREGRPDPDHIRRRGFDFQQSDLLLNPGRRLGPREVTLAAAAGYGEVPVRRKPVVAILATGDELVSPGTLPGPGQIVSSNPLGVAALLTQAGADARLLGIARDNRESLIQHVEAARDADVLVTIGGASVGDHDLVGPVLQSLGMELSFWKIDMRPGKPLLYGRLGPQRVIGLPGNPVSALICTRVFLVPLVRRLLGLPDEEAAAVRAVLAEPVEANGPRQHYMRATLQREPDGRQLVRLARSQDSSLLAPLAASNVLLVRPPHAPALPAGAEVEVLLLDF
nr:MAG: molybdopterin molybdenumtransferase MoeA [Pseudomonadota bacterium]